MKEELIKSEAIRHIVNKGYFGQKDYLSLLSARVAINRSVAKYLKYENSEKLKSKVIERKIFVESYKGNNPAAIRIRNLLYGENLNVLVHGSIGTREENFYSDYDGLVIIKNELFNSKKKLSDACLKLHRCLKILYQFDPLQHHGWFILTESDLKNYPQTYFPHELFEFSRSLLPDKGLEIEISLKDSYDYLEPFNNLSQAIMKKVDSKKLKNLYALKGLLSQFMLLPSLYCQARDKKGIFKKFSFDEARKDFAEDEWAVMDIVSEIRKNWHYDINALQKWMLTRTNKYFRRFIIPFAAPSIPADIKSKLTDDFYKQMYSLTYAMREKLNVSL
ncbi:MAG: hypothetical protein Q7S39_05655 [Ignavibacteria bacterium]|nr:hypothetical protein [Ignavibacteria bacterium]